MSKKTVLALIVTSLLLVPVIYSESGVIGLWLFDEGNGNIAKDLSPIGNDGEVADGVKWVDGKFDKAIEVGGPGKDVVIPYNEIYNQDNFTFECWIYPFNVTPKEFNQIIIAGRGEWGNDAPGAFQLGITLIDGTPNARWFFWVGEWITVAGGPEIEVNKWYHFAGILEGGKKATLYVDGEEAATQDLPTKLAENPHPIYVGSWGAAAPEIDCFHGYIDELRYSDEVLEPKRLGFWSSFSTVTPKDKLSTVWGEMKGMHNSR